MLATLYSRTRAVFGVLAGLGLLVFFSPLQAVTLSDLNDKTKVGLEFNHGSEYWFNFAVAEDDIIAPKTNTRGDVFEAYVTHRVRDKFIVKLDYIHYDYDYSGSGWHLGAPKPLDTVSVLGFPTYSSADKFALSMQARF